MNSKEILRRLEEIEARTEKATQGPWTYGESEREQWVEADDGLIVYLEHYLKPDPTVHEQAKYDFDFIAHSRMDVPWLCELARKLLAVAEAAQEFYDAIYNEKNVYETWPDIMERREVYEAGNRLRKALAALEEENDGDL